MPTHRVAGCSVNGPPKQNALSVCYQSFALTTTRLLCGLLQALHMMTNNSAVSHSKAPL